MAYRSLLDIITALGLTSGLKLCLDAGDASSYSGSGQTIADRSGNANDFKLGTTSGSEASDPTFNGSAGGLSASEYFGFDATPDVMTIVGTNPLQTIHKDNAKFTILVLGSMEQNFVAAINICGDQAATGTGLGFRFSTVSTTGILRFLAGNGSATVIDARSTVLTLPDGVPAMFGVSLDEAVGANGGFMFLNGDADLFNSTYTAPSASNSSGVLAIGRCEGGVTVSAVQSGTKLFSIAIWTGVALTQAQMQAIYYEAGLRTGLVAELAAALSGDGTLSATISGEASLSAALSAEGTLTAVLDGGIEVEAPRLVGPTLLAGAPLGTLPLAAMDKAPAPPSGELSLFEQMADLTEVNLIHLVRLSPLTKVA